MRLFVREWRKHRGLTLEQLASAAGLTAGRLSQIERGTTAFKPATLERIACALDCSPVDLISRDPADPEPIWVVWNKLTPEARRQAIAILRALSEQN